MSLHAPQASSLLASCCWSLGGRRRRRRRHGREPGRLGLELLLDVHLHVVAEHEARVVVTTGIRSGDRRSDGGEARRVVEGGNGAAVAVARRQDAVPRALVPAIAQHLSSMQPPSRQRISN